MSDLQKEAVRQNAAQALHREISSDVGGESDELRWKVHYFRTRPKKAAFATAMIIVTGGIVFLVTQMVSFSALLIFLMILYLNNFFFPAEYILDDEGLTIKSLFGTREFDWGQFKSYSRFKNGIQLNPTEVEIFTSKYRGRFLFYEGNRDAVERYIKEKIPLDGRVDAGRGKAGRKR